MTNRRSSEQKRAILLAISVSLSAPFFAVAVYLIWQAMVNPPRHPGEGRDFSDDRLTMDWDDGIGWVNRPNLAMEQYVGPERRPFAVYTDADGARISGPNAGVAFSRADLIAVGCSQTWGHGVAEEETFVATAARKLGVREKNLAISGQGGVAAMLQIERLGEVRPRAVVYGFWEDHFNRNVRRCINAGPGPCTPYVRIAHDNSGKLGMVVPENGRAAFELNRSFYQSRGRDAQVGFRDDLWWTWQLLKDKVADALAGGGTDNGKADPWKREAAAFVISQLAAAAKARGAVPVVVYIPLYFGPTLEPMPADLGDAVTKAGALLLDSTPILAEMRAEGLAIPLEGDGHLGREAHRRIGMELAALLTKVVNDNSEPRR